MGSNYHHNSHEAPHPFCHQLNLAKNTSFPRNSNYIIMARMAAIMAKIFTNSGKKSFPDVAGKHEKSRLKLCKTLLYKSTKTYSPSHHESFPFSECEPESLFLTFAFFKYLFISFSHFQPCLADPPVYCFLLFLLYLLCLPSSHSSFKNDNILLFLHFFSII